MVEIYISTLSLAFKLQFVVSFVFHVSERSFLKTILFVYYVWVHTCGAHRASFRSWFFPSNMCALGIELRLSGLTAGGEHPTYALPED